VHADGITVEKMVQTNHGAEGRVAMRTPDLNNCMTLLPVMNCGVRQAFTAVGAAANAITTTGTTTNSVNEPSSLALHACRTRTATTLHTISIIVGGKYRRGQSPPRVICGVVRTGMPHNVNPSQGPPTTGWFLDTSNGALQCPTLLADAAGRGRPTGCECQSAGPLHRGEVLTMQLDTEKGTLKFWVNGQTYGPGYRSEFDGIGMVYGKITGDVQWAVTVPYQMDFVRIVPNPSFLSKREHRW
jgi:hypothetical protein